MFRIAIAATVSFALAACGDNATQPVAAGMGPDPALPAPRASWLPTVHVARAVGWQDDETPTPAAGLAVNAFVANLDHPRWLYVLPNGDVLVAETNAPERPEEGGGLRGWFMGAVQKYAGATVPSANRITLLRDADGDGIAEHRTVFLQNLNSPFGMALVGDTLFVANTDAILKFPYETGQDQIADGGTKLVDLPAGPRNHHWTKNIIASPDGKFLYATVGSNSNAGENGLAEEQGRAAIWRIDIASAQASVFASGLRNPNGLGWEPGSGALWTAVNERDELGPDLVPDYMTAVQENGFYGWPFSYFGQHEDARVKAQRRDLVARAIKPDYALGAHTASLGLAFAHDGRLPPAFSQGAFIGQHGSWNRKPFSGYKVIFVPFAGGRPAGAALDVLTGFLDGDSNARGRPVGVALAKDGALLVADDVGNRVWRVTSAGGRSNEPR